MSTTIVLLKLFATATGYEIPFLLRQLIKENRTTCRSVLICLSSKLKTIFECNNLLQGQQPTGRALSEQVQKKQRKTVVGTVPQDIVYFSNRSITPEAGMRVKAKPHGPECAFSNKVGFVTSLDLQTKRTTELTITWEDGSTNAHVSLSMLF